MDSAAGMDGMAMRRRDALALLAGLLALPSGAAQAAEALAQPAASAFDKAAFMEASSLVTGMEADKLTGMVDTLLAAFQAQGPAVLQLAALSKQAPADLAAAIKGTPMEGVAKALAASWYTGTLGAGPSAKLVSYEDAVAWKAAGYDAVPGMCAGEFGFWSEPPVKQ